MASGSNLEKLKLQLICSICDGTLKVPKTLPCLHTFCCQCLNDLACNKKRNDLQPECPNCGNEILTPENGRFDSLPTSSYHSRKLEILAVILCRDRSEVTCGNCQQRTVDSSYCFKCEKFLCCDCLNAHDETNNNRKFNAQEFDVEAQRQPLCLKQYHARESISYFCTECEKNICQVCSLTDHRGHKIEPLGKAAEQQRKLIGLSIEKAEDKAHEYRKIICDADLMSRELESNVHSARRAIYETVEKLKDNIDKIARNTVVNLETVQQMRRQKLSETKTKATIRLNNLQEAIEYARTMKEGAMAAEILQVSNSLHLRFEELQREEDNGNKVSAEISFVEFIPNKETRPPKLGRLSMGKVIASLSSLVTNKVVTPTTNRALNFKVIKTDPFGIKCHDDQTQINFSIEPRGNVTDVETNNNENGEHHVTFVPQHPGIYRVVAKLENEHVENSPFTLEVKARELVRIATVELTKTSKGKDIVAAGLAVSKDGQIAVLDYENGHVHLYSKDGVYLREIGRQGSGNGEMHHPCGVAYNEDGELLVADQGNHRIQVFSGQTGAFLRSFGHIGTANGQFKFPSGLSIDSTGRIIVSDRENRRIQVFDKTEKFCFSIRLNHRAHHCVFYNGMFFVSNSEQHCINVFDRNGKFLYAFGSEGSENGELRSPRGMCVDSHGLLVVCSCGNYGSNCVQVFSLDGRFVGKVAEPISRAYGVAALYDGVVVVSGLNERSIYFLK